VEINLDDQEGNPLPIDRLFESLEQAGTTVTPTEKSIMAAAHSPERSIKDSVMALITDKLSKVGVYEIAAQQILKKIMDQKDKLETEELIALLGTLNRTASTEAKSVLDLFKKNDGNSPIQKLVIEVQGGAAAAPAAGKPEALPNIRPEMMDKMLRLMERVGGQTVVQDVTPVDQLDKEMDETPEK